MLDYTKKKGSDILMELQVPVVSKKTCMASMAGYSNIRITDGMICAGGVAGQDSCKVSIKES